MSSKNPFFLLYLDAACNKWSGLAVVNEQTAILIKAEDPGELHCHIEKGKVDDDGKQLYHVYKIREWRRDYEPLMLRKAQRDAETFKIQAEKERINMIHINFHENLKIAIAREIESPSTEDKMVLDMFNNILEKKKWSLCETMFKVNVPSEVKG